MTTQMKESVSAWPKSSPVFKPDTSPDVDRKIRVAFVEDDDDYREAVSNELGDHGFEVTTFSDGAALLSSFAEGAEAEIVRMYHLEGKSYNEISTAMGMPENSVGPTLSRARSKMRRSASEPISQRAMAIWSTSIAISMTNI